MEGVTKRQREWGGPCKALRSDTEREQIDSGMKERLKCIQANWLLTIRMKSDPTILLQSYYNGPTDGF